MKRVLRILAVCILVSALLFWVAKGANRGWTVNNLAHDTVNPVTGLTATTYEKVFLPGLDFVVLAAFVAAALAGVSFFVPNRKLGPKKS